MLNPLITKSETQNSRQAKTFYCYGYGRKSTEEINTKSLQNQELMINQEFKKIVDSDPYNHYVYLGFLKDEDYTGTNTCRPDFQKILNEITSGKCNMLMVCDLSRLSRNMEHSIHYIQGIFVSLNLRFISLSLPMIDSYLHPNKIYDLDVPIQSIFNENFAKETSQKIRDKFDTMRENGFFIGAFAPYGFIKNPEDKHKFLLDDYVYKIMHQMKGWIFDGITAPEVSKKLNEAGILAPGAYLKAKGFKICFGGSNNPSSYWSSDQVKRILLRPCNVGTLVQGRQKNVSYKDKNKVFTQPEDWSIKENQLPSIFTRDEQKQLVDLLSKRTRKPTKKSQVYLFSGFLKCSTCGMSVTHKSTRTICDSKGKAYNYGHYICSRYRRNKKACTSHRIDEKELEEAVLNVIKNQISLAVDIDEVINKSKDKIITKMTKEDEINTLNILLKEKNKIEQYKKALYENWQDGTLSKEEYLSYKQQYISKENALQSDIDKIENEKRNLKECTSTENKFLKHFLKYKNITILTRDILGELIDNIIIHENNCITVRFKFQDEYKIMLNLLEENALI